MMGADGLTDATQVAILNANYIAQAARRDTTRSSIAGEKGCVAHECIVDMRHFKKIAGIEVEDVAKRLMDYGFHAPTMSFPVPGTLMIEPTESEPKAELDRFCDAHDRDPRRDRARSRTASAPRDGNVLKNAPHTAAVAAAERVDRALLAREGGVPGAVAARRTSSGRRSRRLNNVLGDRKLFCSCPPIESYADDPADV